MKSWTNQQSVQWWRNLYFHDIRKTIGASCLQLFRTGFGLVEREKESLSLLSDSTGWDDVHELPRSNTAGSNQLRLSDLTTAQQSSVKEMVQMDQALHVYANKLMNRRLNSMTSIGTQDK